jgi:hypothetical protein
MAFQNIINPLKFVFEFAIPVLVALAKPIANHHIWYCKFKNNRHVCAQQFVNFQYHGQATTFGIANSKTQT